MANKYIARLLATFDRAMKQGLVNCTEDAWSAIGRDDLRSVTTYRELAGAPLLQSFFAEAVRRMNAAYLLRRAPETIALAGGATAQVIRKDRSRPAPLTHFILSGQQYGDGRDRYFERRPTKGWRWSVADEAEVAAWRKQGVVLYLSLPQDVIRKRRVA